MQKEKSYNGVRFAPEVIEEAFDAFTVQLAQDERNPNNEPDIVKVGFSDETWNYDTFAEFIADYSKAVSFYLHYMAKGGKSLSIQSYRSDKNVNVSVRMPTRGGIEAVFRVFERHLPASAITVDDADAEEPINIFIGHGHSSQWRDLKDHLHEHHGLKVTAYEIGPRAGLTIKEVLDRMLNDSSFALLVLTGEDEDAEGQLHARENVIHEAGLFQGALGFQRAIVLLEQGCKEFSNIHGLNQIRFSKDNIRETFGDVLATIKREFEGEDD